MTTSTELPSGVAGSTAVPQPREMRVTPHLQISAALADVRARRGAWGALGVAARIDLLDRLIADTAAVARRWAEAECERKGLSWGSPASGEEWAVGPWCTLSYMRQLRATLEEIERHGWPRLPGPLRTRRDGRVSARIFPREPFDRVQYASASAECETARGRSSSGLTRGGSCCARRRGAESSRSRPLHPDVVARPPALAGGVLEIGFPRGRAGRGEAAGHCLERNEGVS